LNLINLNQNFPKKLNQKLGDTIKI